MDIDSALEFFAQYGNVSPDVPLLRHQVQHGHVSVSQLADAAHYAVREYNRTKLAAHSAAAAVFDEILDRKVADQDQPPPGSPGRDGWWNQRVRLDSLGYRVAHEAVKGATGGVVFRSTFLFRTPAEQTDEQYCQAIRRVLADIIDRVIAGEGVDAASCGSRPKTERA